MDLGLGRLGRDAREPPPAIGIDADGGEDGGSPHEAARADPRVAGVEHAIGAGVERAIGAGAELPLAPSLGFVIQRLRGAADLLGRREALQAEDSAVTLAASRVDTPS